jgi:hypothetical protein
MKFLLFSEIAFEVSDPIALIESYCFQTNFYRNYDLPQDRRIELVNKIGARILQAEKRRRCSIVIHETEGLNIFKYSLDDFLDNRSMQDHVRELDEKVIKKLMNIPGIGLSKATKVLHTFYPEIIPMIDNPLQKVYRSKVGKKRNEGNSYQILVAYYRNLKERDNRQNLNEVFEIVRRNNFQGLSKLRVFDILWWSYLKCKELTEEVKRERSIDLNLSSMKWFD